jgi:hypothetical protein
MHARSIHRTVRRIVKQHLERDCTASMLRLMLQGCRGPRWHPQDGEARVQQHFNSHREEQHCIACMHAHSILRTVSAVRGAVAVRLQPALSFYFGAQ